MRCDSAAKVLCPDDTWNSSKEQVDITQQYALIRSQSMENDSDSDDSGILVEEVTAAPSDDEGVLVEEVAVSHAEDDYVIADATVANEDASDDDAVVIEDVTHERDSSDRVLTRRKMMMMMTCPSSRRSRTRSKASRRASSPRSSARAVARRTRASERGEARRRQCIIRQKTFSRCRQVLWRGHRPRPLRPFSLFEPGALLSGTGRVRKGSTRRRGVHQTQTGLPEGAPAIGKSAASAGGVR